MHSWQKVTKNLSFRTNIYERESCLMKKFDDLPWEKKEKIYKGAMIFSIIVHIIAMAAIIHGYMTMNSFLEFLQFLEQTGI